MAMGGVGEAMLLGAAMGGGSAALTGGDPLKGAFLGGLTGGAGAGISGALGGAGTNAAMTAAGTEAASTAALGQALPASTLAANPIATGLPAGQNFAQASQAANAASANNAVTGAMNQALPLSANAGITSLPAASTSPLITAPAPSAAIAPQTFSEGMAKFSSNPLASIKANPMIAASSALQGATGARKKMEEPDEYDGPLKRFRYNPDTYRPAFAGGGIANLATGGYDRIVGDPPMSSVNMRRGGNANLGSYSDYANGGRMLKGPGDGMSDSIPASIDGKRPARLAQGEFVVPADVVSHLGNGSTDAGAKQLYAMMNKVRQARTGSKRQGKEINARRFVPA